MHKITAEDFEILAEVLALAEAVGSFSTIVQDRTNLNAAARIICHHLLVRRLDHTNPHLTVTVIDVWTSPGRDALRTPRRWDFKTYIPCHRPRGSDRWKRQNIGQE